MEIDYETAKKDECLDGKFVLGTTTKLPAEENNVGLQRALASGVHFSGAGIDVGSKAYLPSEG